MYDGTDTAYYLWQGYRVVAVEANPYMVERARNRFAAQLASGQLTIVEAAVAADRGVAEFMLYPHAPYMNELDTGVRLAGTDLVSTNAQKIRVQALTFRDILTENGVPYYCKVDIQGADVLCIEDLDSKDLPQYSSVENTQTEDAKAVEDLNGLDLLGRLHGKGYRKFKLIEQVSLRVIDGHFHLGTYADKLVRANLWRPMFQRHSKIRNLMVRATLRNSLKQRTGYEFAIYGHTSGAWGEDTGGNWLDHESAASLFRAYAHERLHRHKLFWCDWHASL